MNTIIELKNVCKSFDDHAVLRGLDWAIEPGRVIGLLGRNGAGKSTLLECLLGLREADQGSVRLFDETATVLSDTVRAKIGYVPQSNEMFSWMKVDHMLAFFRSMYPRWNQLKVEALLERWGFNARLRNSRISNLSGGEKQRLSIIRALAHDPDLLVLDEPVASLDPAARRDFLRELVETVIEHNTTVIFSTHILSDLERVAFDVAFLQQGRIAIQRPLDQLLESTHRISGPADVLGKIRFSEELNRWTDRNGDTCVIASLNEGELSTREQYAKQLRIEGMSLEEVFVEVTQ